MKSLIPWKQKGHRAVKVAGWDDWFDRVWQNPFSGFLPMLSQQPESGIPSVDVSEDKNSYTVRAEMPGLSEKDINLTWHDGVLRISGEKREEKEEKRKNRVFRECSYGSFSRNVPLGDAADWRGAKAKFKNGVLTVTLPKTEKARNAIEIKVA